ncbi:MAG: hypothetical protein ACEPOW_12250 [Bacteroidales bacterium]
MKTRYIKYCVIIVLGFIFSDVTAQEYKVFRFEGKDGKYITTSGDDALSELSLTPKFNHANELRQCFIVKWNKENDYALICSAVDPSKYLFRKGGSQILMEEYNSRKEEDYKWRIDFAGQSKVVISDPKNCLKLLVQEDDEVEFKKVDKEEIQRDRISFKLIPSEVPVY